MVQLFGTTSYGLSGQLKDIDLPKHPTIIN